MHEKESHFEYFNWLLGVSGARCFLTTSQVLLAVKDSVLQVQAVKDSYPSSFSFSFGVIIPNLPEQF